jgi:hypothetical protein
MQATPIDYSARIGSGRKSDGKRDFRAATFGRSMVAI